MMRGSFSGVITAARGRASALAVGVSLATVSLATGFISYTHISALTLDYWQNWKTAHLMPLAVDGQIVIGSVYFMEHSGERKRWLGLIGVVPGILESLYSNWESVSPPPGLSWLPGLEAHFWATVPAQAFACSTILFERWLHSRRAVRPAPLVRPVLAPLAPEPAVSGIPAPGPLPQAPEPAAPGPVPALVHLHAAPQGTPWGLVSPAAVPGPEPARRVVPVLGPVMMLADRPAVPRARKPQAVPDAGAEPLPADPAELTRVVSGLGQNELARRYGISRYRAGQLKKALEDGTLEEVA